jgi:CheY-like chemotaxis protein
MRSAAKTMPNILIVDDHPDTTDLLSRFLRRNGYGVVTAPDGIEALGLLPTLTPDVVLLDQMIPNLDRLGVLDRMCREPRTRDVPS